MLSQLFLGWIPKRSFIKWSDEGIIVYRVFRLFISCHFLQSDHRRSLIKKQNWVYVAKLGAHFGIIISYDENEWRTNSSIYTRATTLESWFERDLRCWQCEEALRNCSTCSRKNSSSRKKALKFQIICSIQDRRLNHNQLWYWGDCLRWCLKRQCWGVTKCYVWT